MATINLRYMKVNQTGTIYSVKVGGELGRRIRDMGLTQVAEISIQGKAPHYDPVALREGVKGDRLINLQRVKETHTKK